MKIYAVSREQSYAEVTTLALFSERKYAELAVKASQRSGGEGLTIIEFELDEWIKEQS